MLRFQRKVYLFALLLGLPLGGCSFPGSTVTRTGAVQPFINSGPAAPPSQGVSATLPVSAGTATAGGKDVWFLVVRGPQNPYRQETAQRITSLLNNIGPGDRVRLIFLMDRFIPEASVKAQYQAPARQFHWSNRPSTVREQRKWSGELRTTLTKVVAARAALANYLKNPITAEEEAQTQGADTTAAIEYIAEHTRPDDEAYVVIFGPVGALPKHPIGLQGCTVSLLYQNRRSTDAYQREKDRVLACFQAAGVRSVRFEDRAASRMLADDDIIPSNPTPRAILSPFAP